MSGGGFFHCTYGVPYGTEAARPPTAIAAAARVTDKRMVR